MCEIMENKPLGSRMKFLWILRVVYFPVKHSCLYNKKIIIYSLLLKTESLDNAILALIGLAIMVDEPLYHDLHIWSVYASVQSGVRMAPEENRFNS